jgi:hypothetical protein
VAIASVSAALERRRLTEALGAEQAAVPESAEAPAVVSLAAVVAAAEVVVEAVGAAAVVDVEAVVEAAAVDAAGEAATISSRLSATAGERNRLTPVRYRSLCPIRLSMLRRFR